MAVFSRRAPLGAKGLPIASEPPQALTRSIGRPSSRKPRISYGIRRKAPATAPRCMWCTDDRHVHDLLERETAGVRRLLGRAGQLADEVPELRYGIVVASAEPAEQAVPLAFRLPARVLEDRVDTVDHDRSAVELRGPQCPDDHGAEHDQVADVDASLLEAGVGGAGDQAGDAQQSNDRAGYLPPGHRFVDQHSRQQPGDERFPEGQGEGAGPSGKP